MDRLRSNLERYSRWQPLNEYIERIEAYQKTNFPFCVENAKSLLESIGKEICCQKNQPLSGNESISRVLNLAYGCLGYPPSDTIRVIGTAIASVAQEMGNFRNEVGAIAHGKTLDELRNRVETIDSLTAEFLLIATELVCCFLIETFEADNPLVPIESKIEFDDNPEFNEYWDGLYGDVAMGNFSFSASAVLFNVEPESYKLALNEFKAASDETNH